MLALTTPSNKAVFASLVIAALLSGCSDAEKVEKPSRHSEGQSITPPEPKLPSLNPAFAEAERCLSECTGKAIRSQNDIDLLKLPRSFKEFGETDHGKITLRALLGDLPAEYLPLIEKNQTKGTRWN